MCIRSGVGTNSNDCGHRNNTQSLSPTRSTDEIDMNKLAKASATTGRKIRYYHEHVLGRGELLLDRISRSGVGLSLREWQDQADKVIQQQARYSQDFGSDESRRKVVNTEDTNCVWALD